MATSTPTAKMPLTAANCLRPTKTSRQNAANIAKGINFGGTTGSNNYALGDTINVKGDSNIISETVAGGAQLKLAKDITVDSVTAGDSKLNSDGLTITGGPSVTKSGIHAASTKITNVAARYR